MNSLDSFLNPRIDRLVATQSAPIDLYKISKRAGVLAVEEREMIPEAVIKLEGEGFRIYLQSNFGHLDGVRVRQRFSLAHEIAHTLFFERRDGRIKPMRSPTGDKLEAACQRGAALMLVPGHLLAKELGSIGDQVDPPYIAKLAEVFDVSVEVMLRRLQEVGAFGSQYAPILVRRKGTTFSIEFAVCPPWLKALSSTPPRRGLDFAKWFGCSDQAQTRVNEILTKQTAQGLLVAHPVDVTPSLRIIELRLDYAEAPSFPQPT